MTEIEKWAQSEEFKHMQGVFQKVTKVSCRLIDYKGKCVSEIKNDVPIVQKAGEWQEIEKAFEQAAREYSVQAVTDGKIRLYRLFETLTFFVVPLAVDGMYLGALQGGPVRTEKASFEISEADLNGGKKAETFCQVHEALIADLPLLSLDQLKSTASMAQMWIGKRVALGRKLSEQNQRDEQRTAIIEQQYKKIEAFERRIHQKPEQQHLEDQLNMHFWFNSLTSAANLAIIEGAMRTNEMITLISDFLRDTLFDHERFWSIAKETEAIECYLRIQGVRFGDRVQYKIDVPRSMMKLCVPKMMLMPFVEFSTVEVINQEAGGQILVKFSKESSHIVCEVQDNAKRQIASKIPSEPKKHYSIEKNIGRVRDQLGQIYGTGYHIVNTEKDGVNDLLISIPESGVSHV
ncbi:histidine kinase [Pseudoramibacter sp.]|jgi:ligand-binding sensor protein|uniref:histidine kinase n=1 Tax=Pseudoramibacter sp. TaxID=2034862 RepID=UPI0025E36736|nr:histidine kinase [Pseudoramibacter sp.]MCH4071993.1 histidine kinase [Pseudoramibacter sp.]MCH4105762.1 histidine kinase [Pseudoramibacter sp.]